ncbi:MAG: DNA topoisomerase IB [Actinobacteria bacterium]|nr:DNA topoisomerase IB [Actinomycetota bacterium]
MKRVDCSGPGIRRRRAGKGFTYYGPDGARVTDPETLARIRSLAIPPAWTDVWISPHPMGHIQAIGVDAKGRKQYRYHDQWRLRRDMEKFDHMLEFARALPKIRHFTKEHLAQDGLTRQRVLACAVRLLDLGFFRVGTEDYAEENQTYGLATMRKKHVRIHGETVIFDYVAKSGKRRIQSVVDADVLAVVRELKARRAGGPELLAWWDGKRWVDVKSGDINTYIKELTGGEFSAKDFRTWNATVLAGVALAVSSTMARSATGRKRAIARAMSEVANYLGNTPAVCRSSYVDPRIIDRYTAGSTVLEALASLDEDSGLSGLHTHGSIEEAVLDLLEEAEAA